MKIGFIFIFLVFFAACGVKNNVKFDKPVNDISEKEMTETESFNFDELEEVYDNLNYDKEISKYVDKLDGNFRIVRFRYFVVFSNLEDRLTYPVIDNDIRHTVDAMIDNYIEKRPDGVTAVFLFRDMDSYKNFAMKEFDIEESDLSPYGFYKISKNVILVRYVSWKGSVAHEVTHAMLQNDFPEIPSWFNEAFAALHEKATYENKKLVANFSWRILSLRRAFDEDTYYSLRHLMNTSDDEMYSEKSSFYYAQGQYALMLLQQKGLMEDYYKNFRDTYSKDPTGARQFEKLTGASIEKYDTELIEYIKSFKQDFK